MWCLFSSLGTSSRSGRCVGMGVVRRILLGVGLVFGMVRYSVGSWYRRSGLDVVRYRDSSGSWSVGMDMDVVSSLIVMFLVSYGVLYGNVSWLRKTLDVLFSRCGLGIRYEMVDSRTGFGSWVSSQVLRRHVSFPILGCIGYWMVYRLGIRRFWVGSLGVRLLSYGMVYWIR